MIFGQNRVIERSIVLIIGINYFTQFMRRSTTLFKTASGSFYNDRFRPFIEGIVNIILSIIFVNIMGTIGVLIATVTARLLITYSYEPHVLFSVSFERDSKKFHLVHYLTPIVFTALVFIYIYLPLPTINNNILNLIVKGLLSLVISFSALVFMYLVFKPFRKTVNELFKTLLSILKSRKKLSK